MELIRGSAKLHPHHRGCVTALGGFDGLHLGHQAVIRRALHCAKAGLHRAGVVLFEPLPHEFLNPSGAVPRLYSLRERLKIIASLGVEQVVCLRFGAEIAAMPAEEFVERVLVNQLQVHTLLVGEGFHFGQDRGGDIALLLDCARRHGFAVECVPPVLASGGERISSTWVRAVLTDGDFSLAARLLGRNYSVSGRVRHGDKRGRKLGFATANLFIGRQPFPLRGVFAVLVEGVGPSALRGVANAGYRPTFGSGGFHLEVHLPGVSSDLYGRRLRVRFLKKIRSEQRFDNVEALRERIREDIKAAMRTASHPPPVPSLR